MARARIKQHTKSIAGATLLIGQKLPPLELIDKSGPTTVILAGPPAIAAAPQFGMFNTAIDFAFAAACVPTGIALVTVAFGPLEIAFANYQ